MKQQLYFTSHLILQSKYKVLVTIILYIIGIFLSNSNIIYLMQDPDDYLHKELVKLMQENARLKENLQTVSDQNNELRNIVRNFMVDKNDVQLQHEHVLHALEFEKIETARQDSLREATSSQAITSLIESQQHFFDESRSLQGQLDEAHQTMGDMAGSNMDLRSEAIEQQRVSQSEIKQLEETIDELTKDQSRRKKTR